MLKNREKFHGIVRTKQLHRTQKKKKQNQEFYLHLLTRISIELNEHCQNKKTVTKRTEEQNFNERKKNNIIFFKLIVKRFVNGKSVFVNCFENNWKFNASKFGDFVTDQLAQTWMIKLQIAAILK